MKKIVLALLFLPALFSCESRKTADLIIHNGVIYTIDEAYSTASAFAVIDGKFAAIGSDEEIFKNYLSENVIDVQQRTIYPGFYDAHCHFYGLGLMSEQLDLTGMDSKEEIVRELQRFRKKHPNSPWLLGRGWDQNLWEDKSMPDADFLSEAFPNTPVYLVRIDGHAGLANETAVSLSGVQAGTEVSGGEAVTKNGKLTGLFIDAATDLLSRRTAPLDAP